MGSSIYLPNYKIPFLIGEVGLHLAACVNYTTVGLLQGTAKADESFFTKDASSAYTAQTIHSMGFFRFVFIILYGHYCASISHALGIPDAYIMQMGGWGNDRVLKEVYRHSFEDRQKEMNQIVIQHFETMKYKMQQKKIKAQ